jgi:trehalose-6-phosphatase
MIGAPISCVLTDFDGTISPLEATREDAKIPSDIEEVLKRIAGQTKLAVVTSKSFDYVSPRIPFADAWGCIGGLDVRFEDGKEFTISSSIDVRAGINKAEAILGDCVTYEEKWSSHSLLGFAVDWRGREAPRELAKLTAGLAEAGFYVSHDISAPFVDFFCSRPDKGDAVVKIKETLGVSEPSMFMGDSSSDNPAFLEVGVSVGIDHGQPVQVLDCDYILKWEEISAFLRALSENNMVFAPDLSGLRRK